MPTRPHSHYFKDVSHLETIDVYRVIDLWNITDPCLQHALKKIMVAGGRGAKDEAKDVQEAIDSLRRWQEMHAEDGAPATRMLDGWNLCNGSQPAELADTINVMIELHLRNGATVRCEAGTVRWNHLGKSDDAIGWRPARLDLLAASGAA